MEKVALDYKGKHFIIADADKADEDDTLNPYVDVERTISDNLRQHVEDCMYYGIPAYIGSDEALKARIEKIQEEIDHAEVS